MIELRLPSLGSDMDEGRLLEWQVQPGDKVKKGQVVAVVDTAKAAIDVECWHEGVVHALLIPLQATIPVGTLMAVLRAPGESAETVERELAALQQQAEPAPTPAATEPAAPALEAPPAPHTTGGRIPISPAARRRAAALGLDIATLGTPRDGLALRLADVEAAAQGASAATHDGQVGAPTSTPPASRADRALEMRRVIAAAMARSKREIPHYYLAEDIEFAHAQAWLDARNAGLPITARLLPAALLLKAVGLALLRYPEFNGYWRDGRFEPAAGVHLGVAVSLREGGLVAPALHDVTDRSVAALSADLLDLVKRARSGALRSSEMSAAGITVTNLGEQGVAQVFGVIYPPQVALIGLGRVSPRAWVVDGAVQALPVLSASLAADHRASDGHRGALLLSALRELLQAPDGLDAPYKQEESP